MPNLLPLAAAPRMAFAAMSADQSVRTSDTREQQVVGEALTAVGLAIQGKLTESDLAGLPVLRGVIERQPDLFDSIKAVGGADVVSAAALGASVKTMISQIAGGAPVTSADLKTPPFQALDDLLSASDRTALFKLK